MKKLIVLASMLSGMWAIATVPVNGLVDRWEFSNTLTSGNGFANQGSGSSVPIFVADRCGIDRSALSFDGVDDYLNYNWSGSIPVGTAARSVSFWMRTNNTYVTNSTASVKSLFCYGQSIHLGGGPGGAFEIDHNYCANGIGFDVSNKAITRPLPCLTNNIWHHVVAIWGGGNVSFNNIVFYVDGNPVITNPCQITAGTQVLNTIMSSLEIGRSSDPNDRRFYKGELDDYYFYDRALTAAEVMQLFNADCGFTGPSTFCPNDPPKNFSTSAYLNATYSWSFPAGWTFTSSNNQATGTPGPNAQPGNVQVVIATVCGNITRTFPVSLDPSCIGDPPLGCCLGNLCTDQDNPLAGEYKIKLNNFDFNFTDDEHQKNKVNVGYNCGSAPIGKFNSYTGKITNSSPTPYVSPKSVSVYGNNGYNFAAATSAGVMGESSNGETTGESIGVWGKANNGYRAVGVFGNSRTSNSQNQNNFGGEFQAEGSSLNNIGVYTTARPSTGNNPPNTYAINYASGANIGIYAAGEPANSKDGAIGKDWAAWLDGDLMVNGTAYYTNFTPIISDKRFKTQIKPLESVSEKLMKINGYTYKLKCAEFPNKGFDNAEQIGFIAQEIKEVFPQLVKTDANGYLAVNYQGMIPVLIEAFKSQQAQIDELKQLLATNGPKAPENAIAVELTDKQTVVLEQNVPNPFYETTLINYFIPEGFGTASIIFSNSQGNIIKVVEITQKGKGALQVFASDLTHGAYSYALMIDGKVIDSKKMIRE